MKNWIIVYFPWKVKTTGESATSIRPWKMVQAFESLGLEVIVIHGNPKEKNVKYIKAKNRVRKYGPPLFCYMETATWPLLMISSFLGRYSRACVDHRFLAYMRVKKIPTCVFIRDAFWLNPEVIRVFSTVRRLKYKVLSILDYGFYSLIASIIAMPNGEIFPILPFLQKREYKTISLPPGVDRQKIHHHNNGNNSKIILFYVGGIGAHYRMEEFFTAVGGLPALDCIICCRVEEWKSYSQKGKIPRNVKVIHKSGESMLAEMRSSDIGLLVVKPSLIWEYAVPVKLYDYLASGLPVLVSRGTYVARFVEKNDCGWVVDYKSGEISRMLNSITKEDIIRKSINAISCAKNSSWEVRAELIVRLLGEKRQK